MSVGLVFFFAGSLSCTSKMMFELGNGIARMIWARVARPADDVAAPRAGAAAPRAAPLAGACAVAVTPPENNATAAQIRNVESTRRTLIVAPLYKTSRPPYYSRCGERCNYGVRGVRL